MAGATQEATSLTVKTKLTLTSILTIEKKKFEQELKTASEKAVKMLKTATKGKGQAGKLVYHYVTAESDNSVLIDVLNSRRPDIEELVRCMIAADVDVKRTNKGEDEKMPAMIARDKKLGNVLFLLNYQGGTSYGMNDEKNVKNQDKIDRLIQASEEYQAIAG